MSNVVIDRVCARLLSAALNINEAADGIEDRDAISLVEIEDLKQTIGAAARSLDLCSTFLIHMEADLLTPGISSDDLDKRAAIATEVALLTTIRKALAGERTPSK